VFVSGVLSWVLHSVSVVLIDGTGYFVNQYGISSVSERSFVGDADRSRVDRDPDQRRFGVWWRLRSLFVE
jgi:hypothetical protein